MKRILSLTAILLMVLGLSACQLYNHDYKEDVLEYAMIVTDGSELSILDQYPNLEYVDLRGSTCYEEILDYSASHPTVKVRFSIELGQQPINQDATEIRLYGYDATFEDLKNNLKFFRFLNSVHIDQISITKEQLDELKSTYPQIDFTYTVKLGKDVHDATVKELNISEISSKEVELALTVLEHLPDLTRVDLVNAGGESNLSVNDCKALMEAYPHISFHYQFSLFGQTLSTKTESVTYKDVMIGNGGLEDLRMALAVMPNCKYMCLDNCNIDNESLDKFRADFPDKSIVWRVFIDKHSVLTDAEVISLSGVVRDSDAEPLKYCTNVKYLDMTGCKIRDFAFLAGMTKLECAVLQQTHISDLSVLSNCSNLVWLDLVNCTSLKDVTPLANVASLKYLNLSLTKVKELSPLDQIPLERFKCVKGAVSDAELDTFRSKHPQCLTSKTGSSVGKGWRYNDGAQREPFEYYTKMIEVFGYDK